MAKICVVDGCEKNARSPKADLCPMHYHRKYRHGDVNKTRATADRAPFKREYKNVHMPGHPLMHGRKNKNSPLYEHRVVLYDTIGPGPHNCHWCGKLMQWNRGGPLPQLQVDHLNSQTGDNRPENLVPACNMCNSQRGQSRVHEELVALGFWSANDTVAKLAERKSNAQHFRAAS